MTAQAQLRPSRRRRGAVVAVAALAVGAMGLAACGGDDTTDSASDTSVGDAADPSNCPVAALDDADAPVEVTVWHAYNALTQQALEAVAAEYNASQDAVRVSVEAQGTYPELFKKYSDSLGDPAGLPDVVFAEDTNLRFLADSGTVIPAADCIAADDGAAAFYDDLLPAVENAYSLEGDLWAAAYGVSMPVLYLNNAHLEAAGVDTSTPPETLDEVRAAAEQIDAADLPGVEEPTVIQLDTWYVENWLSGVAEPIVDADNGRSGIAEESLLDNESTNEIVSWLDAMQADGLLKAYPYSGDISQFLALGNQTSSMLIDGSRAITTVDAVVSGGVEPTEDLVEGSEGIAGEDLAGLDVTVAPVPGLEEAGRGAVWGSAAYLLAGEDPARIAGGWDFLQFFNSTDNQVRWLLDGSYLPVTESLQDAPEVQAYFTDSRAGQWLGVVNEQLLSLDPDAPGPAMGPYNEFRAGMRSMLDDVVLGSAEPSAGISEVSNSLTDQLMRYADEVR